MASTKMRRTTAPNALNANISCINNLIYDIQFHICCHIYI